MVTDGKTTNMTNQMFSVFREGYKNEKKQQWVLQVKPMDTWTIEQAYAYVRSDEKKEATLELRRRYEDYRSRKESMTTADKKAVEDMLRDFKAEHFMIACFAGIFSYRNAKSLAVRSPYMPIDIDDLSGIDEARDLQQKLAADKHFKTALCFVSPKGHGVKWICVLPDWLSDMTYLEQFNYVRSYVGAEYGYDPDTSGKDVSRACFLGWDDMCISNL